jgi:hypothetical protein
MNERDPQTSTVTTTLISIGTSNGKRRHDRSRWRRSSGASPGNDAVSNRTARAQPSTRARTDTSGINEPKSFKGQQ